MTDRIQAEFELFAQREGFDVEKHMGRCCRPVTRNMWPAWQHQAERITDMAAALDRSHKRITELLKQCRDHDTRRAAVVQQALALADEVARLNDIIGRLAAEGHDAHEM